MKKLLFLPLLLLLGSGCDMLGAGFRNAQEIPVQSYGITQISTSTHAYTLTAAQICNSSILELTSLSSTQDNRGTVFTTAGTSTMFSSCLSTVGKQFTLLIVNGAANTTSLLTVPAGAQIDSNRSTSFVSTTLSTSTPENSTMATFFRDTSSTYLLKLY